MATIDLSTKGFDNPVEPYLGDHAIALLARYFDGTEPGGWYERLDGGGDRPEAADVFTAADVVAAGLLGRAVPPGAAIALLETRRDELAGLLQPIPSDIDLPDAPADLIGDPDSRCAVLWLRLSAIDGIHWSMANRLLARKRPRLFPVYDSVVMTALQPNSREFWRPLRATLLADDRAVFRRLLALRSAAGLPDTISPLRILHVAVLTQAASGGTPA